MTAVMKSELSTALGQQVIGALQELGGEAVDLIPLVAEIQQDMAEAALMRRQDLVEQALDQLKVVKAIVANRVAMATWDLFNTIVKTAVKAATTGLVMGLRGMAGGA